MSIIEEILEAVQKTEKNNITNIIIPYQDLEGNNFFERMDFLHSILKMLHYKHNLILVEDKVVPKKHWMYNIPIYFNYDFRYIQFDLERKIQISLDDIKVECGSIWYRTVDGTVIEVQSIHSNGILYTKTLFGPGVIGDSLNESVLKIFWTKA